MSGPSIVEDVFLAVLEKGTPEERATFLSAACKDDADLRRRVLVNDRCRGLACQTQFQGHSTCSFLVACCLCSLLYNNISASEKDGMISENPRPGPPS